MPEYSTAQQDGRACVVCNQEDGAMQPAGFGPCGQLFAHVSCQDGNQVAAQLDAQAEALRNRAGADYRVARALRDVAGAVRSGRMPSGFVGVPPDRIPAAVASFAGMIGGPVR